MNELDTGILAGMAPADLRAALAALQKALLDLTLGVKEVSVSYTQGDGSRSVTFTPTDTAKITALIQTIQAQLGIASGRRAMTFRFR